MDLELNRQTRTILISNAEQVELRDLYSTLREWEYDNIVETEVARGCGSVQVSSGVRTSPIVTLIGGWRILSKEKVTIVGGLFRAEDEDGNYVSPVAAGFNDNITVRN
jgi:hypothetical protein